MTKNQTLNLGDMVEVKTGDGDKPGSFVGMIVFVDRNGARIRPENFEIRQFLGGDGTYTLGVAHWPSRVTILDE